MHDIEKEFVIDERVIRDCTPEPWSPVGLCVTTDCGWSEGGGEMRLTVSLKDPAVRRAVHEWLAGGCEDGLVLSRHGVGTEPGDTEKGVREDAHRLWAESGSVELDSVDGDPTVTDEEDEDDAPGDRDAVYLV